jgi:hypothetical protein
MHTHTHTQTHTKTHTHTVPPEHFEASGSFSSSQSNLHECHNGVTMVLHKCYTCVTRVLDEC